MSKIFNSAQVVIVPKQSRYENVKLAEAYRTCERIVSQVKRHVDDIGEIVIENTDPICAYCGKKWTEDNARYNGGCCKEDEEGATPEERRAVYPDNPEEVMK